MLVTIISFVAILSILVFVHELGHFLAARKFGAKAEEFGLGFPPRLFGWYKNASGKWKMVFWNAEVKDAVDTVYSLNSIPLGGFVKIKGEDGEGKTDESSFAQKPISQRTIILAAGVTMNVILAAVIISGILLVGSVQPIEGVPLKGAIIKDRHIQISSVTENSPAAQAGVQPGDRIVSINNQEISSTENIQNFVADKSGQTLSYKLQRKNEFITKEITPVILEETNRGGIGITISEMASVRYPWYLAAYEGVKTTGYYLWMILVGFYDLLSRLVTGGGVSADIAGPVGIAVLTGQVVSMGFAYILQFAALLSLNLAVINILPIPALDGGRILFLIIEKIKGRPAKQQTEALIHNIGFILLIGLIILVTFKDIKNLFN
jgi:regulator of sigma E protease